MMKNGDPLFFEHMIVGLLIVGLPVILTYFPPTSRNSIYGYRTERSMASPESWTEANQYFTRLSIRFSIVVILIQILLFLTLKSDKSLLLVCGIWIASLIFQAILTEQHLKKTFKGGSPPTTQKS